MVTLSVRLLSGLESMVGLIGKKPNPIMFYTRFGIHTFGLKFPIDVLILDKNNKVVKIQKNLKPNKIFIWNPKFNKVIELPKGTIEEKKIKLGDTLKLLVE